MLKQILTQKLLQRLSPQQIQLMKLMQLPTVAMEQRIKEEMETNPALEEGADDDLEETLSQEEENEETLKDGDTGDNPEAEGGEPEEERDYDLTDYLDDDYIPDYKLYANNRSSDDEIREVPIVSGATFHDLLKSQLGFRILSERQTILAHHLIGNLDENGYLRRELSAVADDIAFSLNVTTNEQELELLLKTIQELDPPGVGARNLQECLLLQLSRKEQQNEHEQEYTEPVHDAKRILQECFDEFTKKHYEKIENKIEIKETRLKAAIDVILKLNPKPGNTMSGTEGGATQIIPDFIINNSDGELEVTLNSRNAPDLRLSRGYSQMLEQYSRNKKMNERERKEALQFVKQKVDAAKWFIDAVNQRYQTLLYTMQSIADFQKDYFLEGDETKLKPMILKDIAERIGMDISTVSRVANSKYVQTPYGTFLLKTFFSESLSTDAGEEVSTREVKKILMDMIEAEDKNMPVTDEKLMKILKAKGYNIARRTVAKYREQLNIPVARMRKEL